MLSTATPAESVEGPPATGHAPQGKDCAPSGPGTAVAKSRLATQSVRRAPTPTSSPWHRDNQSLKQPDNGSDSDSDRATAADDQSAPRRSSRLRSRRQRAHQRVQVLQGRRESESDLLKRSASPVDSHNRNRNPRTTMSTTGKWREEQILIICPGSRTTMAQLGCSELTPPTHRIPTRMFRDGDQWRPYHTYLRTRIVGGVEQEEWVEDVDEEKGAIFPVEGGRIANMDAFLAFLDHVHSLLTTTYHNTPIMLMASPQWTRPDCEAIAQYIFEKTRTPALCMIHSGLATQYGLKWPNMTVIDIGFQKVDVTAIHDGRVVNHVDLGPSAITQDGNVSGGDVFTQRLMKLLGSQKFTHDMAEQLKRSNICEVLPYAPGEPGLAEIPTADGSHGLPPSTTAAPASAEETSAASAPKPAETNGDNGENGENGENGNGNGNGNGNSGDATEDDGVLDVAAIVNSGQTKEFLAKKEKEKGKPGRKPKDKDADAAAAKAVRLPNSKRKRNNFAYEEVVQELVVPEPEPEPVSVSAPEPAKENIAATETNADVTAAAPAPTGPSGDAPKDGQTTDPAPAPAPTATNGEEASSKPAAEPPTTGFSTDSLFSSEVPAAAAPASAPAPAPESAPAPASAPSEPPAVAPKSDNAIPDTPEYRAKRVKREIEVGIERFTFAERQEIDRIVTAIYRTVQGIEEMYMRPPCWDNLVFVGNGSRLRGLKENILQTLNARHLVSPSTATMFTSELPSNMATPSGTGSQTPTGSFTGMPHQLSASGVNPLLQAATTGAIAAVSTPQAGSDAGGPTVHYTHFHSQTPTSIKTATLPNYLGEWTKNGFEESMFLGAQVAARIAFSLHSNMDAQSIDAQRYMSLSRVDYKYVTTHNPLIPAA